MEALMSTFSVVKWWTLWAFNHCWNLRLRNSVPLSVCNFYGRECWIDSLQLWNKHQMWQILYASNPTYFDFRPSLVAHFLCGAHRQIPANHVDENLFDVSRCRSPNRLCCFLWRLDHCGQILHARSNACLVLVRCVSRGNLLSLWILWELFWWFHLPWRCWLP